MAFASARTRTEDNVVGDRRIVVGTFTNGGADTGGNIDTGLQVVEHMTLQLTGAAVGANAPAINETFPADGSAVTIVTDADADGIWMAYGY